MKLKALKAKSKYKNENAWLDAVYRKNKNLIDFSFPERGGLSSKKLFKMQVKQYKELENGRYSTYKSVQLVAKSSSFTSKDERLFQENLFKGLASNTRASQRFEKLSGEKIKNVSIKDLKYEGSGQYSYKGVIIETRYNNAIRIIPLKELKNER